MWIDQPLGTKRPDPGYETTKTLGTKQPEYETSQVSIRNIISQYKISNDIFMRIYIQ